MAFKITESPHCIIHRDYHPWNIILSEAGNMFVVDLECGLGDFRFDVAWTYTLMERSGYSDFSKVFFKQYEEICGEKIMDFDFFKYLAIIRWLINVSNSLNCIKETSEDKCSPKICFLEEMVKQGMIQIGNI
jgi:aminoglycoside phosphotransferase (APT) family kinase protein